jgi:hypothetical protein
VRLVEQRDVGRRHVLALDRRRGAQEQIDLLVGEQLARGVLKPDPVLEQLLDQRLGRHLRPGLGHEPLVLARLAHRGQRLVLPGQRVRVEETRSDQPGEALAEALAARLVAARALAHRVHQHLQVLAGDLDFAPAPERDRRALEAEPAPQQPLQHDCDPRAALQRCELPALVDLAVRARDQGADRPLLDAAFPERGQHLLDVADEGLVRPDDEHPGASEVGIGVEQPRRPV